MLIGYSDFSPSGKELEKEPKFLKNVGAVLLVSAKKKNNTGGLSVLSLPLLLYHCIVIFPT